MRRSPVLFAALLLLAGGPARAQAGASAEARTARYLESVRDDPSLLVELVRHMPKGGDLHNHLSGAVYAESYVLWAAESGACVVQQTLTLVPAPCDSAAGRVPAAQALRSSTLYGQLIDAWSMRNWNPAQRSGHDQFFDTFGRFGAATYGRTGDMLAEAASRAAEDRLSYLELMLTPDEGRVSRLGRQTGWDADFGRMREKLLAAGLRDTLAVARRLLDSAEARERGVLRCGGARQDPGCGVVVRYLYQVSRGGAPEAVFAQILAGFEMSTMDPRVVGFNLVQPEDALVPMRDFTLQMRMIDYLHALYPNVRISLHAGELAPGLVPPEGLRFHIRQSVELGHASRIGHGVDVMHEDEPLQLLREMAARHVLVEIALTSNDVILGVRGKRHPLRTYLRYGVPTALVTDDEGVARSDMNLEWMKGIEEQGLDYPTLKRMARNSLEYAFVEGASVWRSPGSFAPVEACAAAAGGMAGTRCRDFAAGSTRARLQRELELAFAELEARYGSMTPPAAR